MFVTSANPPIILTFSALDPSGIGGIQADIETAASLGCHCAPVVTSICTEGSTENTETLAVDSPVIIEQARSILEEMKVSAIKIGFVGSIANAEAIHTILEDYADIPVVSHPVLCLWNEENFEQADLPSAFSALILPNSTVASFSLYEAREIAQEADNLDATANAIISSGTDFTFITGTGQDQKEFRNSLFGEKGLIQHYAWEQEPLTTHGTNSTLAMSTASYLAHGIDVIQAVEQSQNFTWQSIRASRELGFNRRSPHRFFWADKNIETPDNLPSSKNTH